jgi:hypothetical protein
MKTSLAALALLFAASPAGATGGFDCWTADRRIAAGVSFGNAFGMPVDGAYVEVDGRLLSTDPSTGQLALVRRWLDEEEVKFDLAARDEDRWVARLRVHADERGNWSGTLVYEGASHPVRCEFERMDE